MATPKSISKAATLINQARAEVDEDRAKVFTEDLKTLYVRLGKAEEVVTNIKHEIEIKEAEIHRIFNGS